MENKLKIMLAGPVPPELGGNNRGGVARHLWSLAQALKEKGHEVCILALGRYFQGTKQVNGIRVHGLSVSAIAMVRAVCLWMGQVRKLKESWRVHDLLYLLYTIYRLLLVRNLKKFDAIHVHGPYTKVTTASHLLQHTGRVIVTVHSYHSFGYYSQERKTKQNHRVRRLSRLLSDADAVVHVSEADREKGRELGVRWNAEDYVVHNAVSNVGTRSDAAPLDMPSDKHGERMLKGICFVGSLIERKGVRLLLTAWEQHSIRDEPLLMVGTGPLESEVNEAAVRTGSIKALGYQSPHRVRRLMRSSKALVVPSFSESFGLVYLEALLEGTPVVGYHKTLEEFVRVLECTEEERRFIIPIDAEQASPRTLSQAIRRAIEAKESDHGGDVAHALADKVAARFGWDRAVERMERIYTKVLKDPADSS